MKMGAVCSSETLVLFYHTIDCVASQMMITHRNNLVSVLGDDTVVAGWFADTLWDLVRCQQGPFSDI
jgi:hypothetical protein